MFDFVDLFAGIGGFHAALSSLGGRAVQAAEIDPRAAAVYRLNWGLEPNRDVRELATRPGELVRPHAVLAAGFPCQPFSKSGYQRGMAEERGTLFDDIAKILTARRPPLVVLENVRNIAGPRQRATWRRVVEGLRGAGYLVSSTPSVFSPHLLPPSEGGSPQVRERVYVLGTYVGPRRALRETDVAPLVQERGLGGWTPDQWSIHDHVVHVAEPTTRAAAYRLDSDEHRWIDTWNDLLARLGPNTRLPGLPLWSDVWLPSHRVPVTDPGWKVGFQERNLDFYRHHRSAIDDWRAANPWLASFPPSRRKLEWQAQDAPRDLWQLLLHFRPSGIRAKRPTYAPALVAMGQTSVLGPERRRLTPQETTLLQGFPRGFRFGAQVDSLTYRQLGNAVHVGTVRYVVRRYVERHAELVASAQDAGAGADGRAVAEAVLTSPAPYHGAERPVAVTG